MKYNAIKIVWYHYFSKQWNQFWTKFLIPNPRLEYNSLSTLFSFPSLCSCHSDSSGGKWRLSGHKLCASLIKYFCSLPPNHLLVFLTFPPNRSGGLTSRDSRNSANILCSPSPHRSSKGFRNQSSWSCMPPQLGSSHLGSCAVSTRVPWEP